MPDFSYPLFTIMPTTWLIGLRLGKNAMEVSDMDKGLTNLRRLYAEQKPQANIFDTLDFMCTRRLNEPITNDFIMLMML